MSGDFVLPEKGAVSEGDAVMCGSINVDEIPSSCKVNFITTLPTYCEALQKQQHSYFAASKHYNNAPLHLRTCSSSYRANPKSMNLHSTDCPLDSGAVTAQAYCQDPWRHIH